jgi:hypothetical protein
MLPPWVVARSGFAVVEADARIRWRLRGAPTFDAAVPTGPFTTLVAFLPPPFAARLVDAIGALSALSGHYRYPPMQLHVTIRNLDGADLARLPALLASQQSIRLKVDGLGFTRETLLLRLLIPDPVLRRLRMQLDGLPGMRAGRSPLRELVFANVLRLNGPVAVELRRSVKQQRHTLVGEELELDELMLIRTDKVGGPDHTEVLSRYALSTPRREQWT